MGNITNYEGFKVDNAEFKENVYEWRQIEDLLKKRIAYEKMLVEISAQAVSIVDLDSFLNSCMFKIGKTLNVSRVYIFEYQPTFGMFHAVCEWANKGIPTSENLNLDTFSIPWAEEQLKSGQILNFQNIEEIPEIAKSEKSIVIGQNIKSILVVPLFIKNKFYGFMGFDECLDYRKWTDEDVDILVTASRIITRAIENKFAEDELSKQRSLMEAIFRSVKDAIITVDSRMKVIQANNATEYICGVSVKNIIGKPFTDCMNQCAHLCQAALWETLKDGSVTKDYQIECRQSGLHKQTVLISSSPLLEPDGNSAGAVLVVRDITKLSKIERELKERKQFHNIIGKDEKMQEIYNMIEDLADIDTTVLITGESGTGKELIARALHYCGNRGSKPFVAVNCSALSESLLESELFGHVKGSFTGALKDRIGRIESADGGTIFLDEIGDISPLIQLKLLRVLQEKEFERVGESIPKKADVRVIASTNCNLKEKILRGEFRKDLYYRLKVVEIHLPPLRERLGDIPLLVNHFCKLFNKKFKKEIKGISEDVLNAFMSYSWPGNIRELEHAIEHAFILCDKSIIEIHHIPFEIRDYKRPEIPQRGNEINQEIQEILHILNKTAWNKAKASRLLNMHRTTLYRKIKKYKLIQSNFTL